MKRAGRTCLLLALALFLMGGALMGVGAALGGDWEVSYTLLGHVVEVEPLNLRRPGPEELVGAPPWAARGGDPCGGREGRCASRAGPTPFLFLREKETVLDAKEKDGGTAAPLPASGDRRRY